MNSMLWSIGFTYFLLLFVFIIFGFVKYPKFPTTQNRKQEETKWIIKLPTHVKGLNADVGIVRYYKYFADAADVNNNNNNKDKRSVERATFV